VLLDLDYFWKYTHNGTRYTAEFVIDNLTNKVAAYNFLSTFSGTHFLQPRTYIGKIGLAF
jgi:hypothetical protein